MNGRDDIELLERIYDSAFRRKLQERLDGELEEERAFSDEDLALVCTDDICMRDTGYCRWCGRGE